MKQYTYLGFTFIPSGKKHQGIENLIAKFNKQSEKDVVYTSAIFI